MVEEKNKETQNGFKYILKENLFIYFFQFASPFHEICYALISALYYIVL